MQPAGLHWFRRKQRTLSRAVLAAFCLTWLQFASIPCVMALDSASRNLAASTVGAATPMAQMPDGMVMAPGEHCRYCPSPQPEPRGGDPAVCSFPHDPQVDLRVGFAAALLATAAELRAVRHCRCSGVRVESRRCTDSRSGAGHVARCQFLPLPEIARNPVVV